MLEMFLLEKRVCFIEILTSRRRFNVLILRRGVRAVHIEWRLVEVKGGLLGLMCLSRPVPVFAGQGVRAMGFLAKTRGSKSAPVDSSSKR